MDLTAQEDYKYSSVLDLHKTDDATVLISSHDSVVEFHGPNMETRELCHNHLAGDPWTEEEREVARQKKKPLPEFNPLKTSERTFVGSMIQQRFDIKPAPREPTDQNKSDIYSAMYHWTADLTETRYKDPNLVRAAWAGGNGWQESFVEVTPGKKPRIIVNNENNFAVYPDPNRRDLVNNSDCEFIDRVSWMSRSQLADAIPDKEDEILSALPDPTRSDYEKTKVYADRSHESSSYRNGKYKVIERFYKVRKKNWYGVTPNGEKEAIGQDVSQETRESYKEDYPEHTVYMEREEYLFLAIVCPSIGGVFLYNGEYHCQPRDTTTGKIMFPLVELVDEELDGQTSGHVFPQISGIHMVNALLANKLFAAKNASGQSHVGSSDHFDETTREDIAENHNDGSRTFWKKPGAPEGSGMTLIEQGRAAPDNDYLLEFASNYVVEVSSTPPSMKGFVEGSASGILNDQRIQQAAIQTQGFNNNYAGFLTRRAKLWKYYWKEYWKAEEVIRVLEKKDDKDPDWIKINEIAKDEFGNVTRKNSFDDADAYDITFEDSFKSPTMRDKILKQLAQMGQNAQNDAELNTLITAYSLHLSDAPQDFKNQVKQLQDQRQQAQEAAATAGPQPEPIRLSMSIKSEDLHDQNTILMLEKARVLTPELAQMMIQTPAAQTPADPSIAIEQQAEAQARQMDGAAKAQEMQLKATELQLKAQEIAAANELKSRELAIKEGELAIKSQAEQTAAYTAANQPPVPMDTTLEVAQIKAATEIEKAHIAAAASIHQTEISTQHADESKRSEDAKKKDVTTKSAESAKAVEAVTKAQAQLAEKVVAQGKEFGTAIQELSKAIHAPKKITVIRDADGKITGASATIEGGQ
ncbi:MAG: hypothetical protein M3Y08_01325 [Fibrobacterota bacterium]|nr:hypothetical protein [Fibrobacterota bacterium]